MGKDLIGPVAVFIILLAAIVALRVRTGNRVEIKTSDMALALIPIALWLFTSGRIQELTVGDVKIVAVIQQASTSPVSAQVTPLPVDLMSPDAKASVFKLPELKRKGVQALSFQLGHGGYYGPAVQEYFAELAQVPSFRYVVINRPDGTLFGVLEARQAASLLKPGSGQVDPGRFAQWLNDSSTTEVSSLPGFIPAKSALRKDSETRAALALMNSLDAQSLPVVDDAGRFVGIVDRSKLSASMLIEIADKVSR